MALNFDIRFKIRSCRAERLWTSCARCAVGNSNWPMGRAEMAGLFSQHELEHNWKAGAVASFAASSVATCALFDGAWMCWSSGGPRPNSFRIGSISADPLTCQAALDASWMGMLASPEPATNFHRDCAVDRGIQKAF